MKNLPVETTASIDNENKLREDMHYARPARLRFVRQFSANFQRSPRVRFNPFNSCACLTFVRNMTASVSRCD